MSLNCRFGIDPKKTKRFGNLFHTIDFKASEHLTSDHYVYSDSKMKNRSVGTLFIGKQQYKMSIRDLKEIKTEYSCLESNIWRERPKSVSMKIKSTDYTLTRHEFFRVLETVEGALENMSKSFQMGLLR